MGLFELLVIGGILLVVFDRGRLPRLSRSMGDFVRALKSGAQGKEDIDVTDVSRKKERDPQT